MGIQNIQDLLEVIERKYKSLVRPDYSFANKAISSRPYDSMVKKLQNMFDVEEITDTNDDVSFCYMVSKSNNQWVIELSMLGLYATLFRVSQTGRTGLVTQNTSMPEEKEIISLLLENQFKILNQDELEHPVALKLFNAEPENVCIYQALFSDTDILPWRV